MNKKYGQASTRILLILLMVSLLHICQSAYEVNNVKKNVHKTLKLVHLLYRHGARSPTAFYPTNPHIKDWLDGPGRLTQIGMRLEYELGKFLKGRYMINTTFLNQMYLHNEVYIRSSDSERCLQSAQTQLAGLYPPIGRQIWNENIPWQPVPVHSVPGNQDPLLRPDDTNCPRRDEILEAKKSEPLYKKKLEENQGLLQYLTKHAGMDVTFDNIEMISDTYLCEKRQGFSTPQWLLDRLNETLSISAWLFLNRFQGSDELGRLLGGSLLDVINNNMKDMSEHQTQLFKMILFSGHDTSILSLSTALNINMSVPTFASCIMIELYQDEASGFYVEMQYRNDSTGTLFPLKLNECDFSCPLDEFIRLTKNRVTSDQAAECHISTNKKSRFLSWNTQIILMYVLGGIFVFLLLTHVIVHLFYRKQIKKFPHEDKIGPYVL